MKTEMMIAKETAFEVVVVSPDGDETWLGHVDNFPSNKEDNHYWFVDAVEDLLRIHGYRNWSAFHEAFKAAKRKAIADYGRPQRGEVITGGCEAINCGTEEHGPYGTYSGVSKEQLISDFIHSVGQAIWRHEKKDRQPVSEKCWLGMEGHLYSRSTERDTFGQTEPITEYYEVEVRYTIEIRPSKDYVRGTCPRCTGAGEIDSPSGERDTDGTTKPVQCPTCEGSGIVLNRAKSGPSVAQNRPEAPSPAEPKVEKQDSSNANVGPFPEDPSYDDLRWRVLGLEEELDERDRQIAEMMKESAPLSKFIAIGPMCWGKNDVLEEAVKGCLSYWPREGYGKKDRKRLFIYLCDEGAYVDGMGSLNYTNRMVIQRGSDRRRPKA